VLTGQTVYLVREQSDRNAENQLLRHVLRADGTIVAAQLIADGWAQPLSIAPDTARIADYERLAADFAALWPEVAAFARSHADARTS
jgi:endonuclease YncB( thermonuclease family)